MGTDQGMLIIIFYGLHNLGFAHSQTYYTLLYYTIIFINYYTFYYNIILYAHFVGRPRQSCKPNLMSVDRLVLDLQSSVCHNIF